MTNKTINFEDKKINKSNLYKNKNQFNIHDLDVNKMLLVQKVHLNTLLDLMMMTL